VTGGKGVALHAVKVADNDGGLPGVALGTGVHRRFYGGFNNRKLFVVNR